MVLTALIIAGLATWRLSSLLVHEDGPWDIMLRLRHWARADGDEVSGVIALALQCIWCVSVWVAPVMLALALMPLLWVVPAIMAVSAVAILVERAARP